MNFYIKLSFKIHTRKTAFDYKRKPARKCWWLIIYFNNDINIITKNIYMLSESNTRKTLANTLLQLVNSDSHPS